MTNQPIRVQRKRSKGWTKPENTLCVTRPGKYGNPFVVGIPVQNYEVEFLGIGCYFDDIIVYANILEPFEHREAWGTYYENQDVTPTIAVQLYEGLLALVKDTDEVIYAKFMHELKAQNLACFCPVGSPCHADVLLRLANQPTTTENAAS